MGFQNYYYTKAKYLLVLKIDDLHQKDSLFTSKG